LNQDTALAKTLSVLKDAEAEGRRFVMTIEGTGEEVSLGSGINETAIKIIVEARLAKKFYTIKTEPDQTAPDGGTNLSTATAENHHSADTRRATKNNHVTTTGTTDPEESENNISFRDSNGNPEEDETTNTVDTFNSKPKATARGCRAQLKKKNISSAVGATNDPSDATDVSLSTPEKKHAAWSLQNSKGSAAINADRPSLEEAGEAKESGDDTTDKTEDATDKTEDEKPNESNVPVTSAALEDKLGFVGKVVVVGFVIPFFHCITAMTFFFLFLHQQHHCHFHSLLLV